MTKRDLRGFTGDACKLIRIESMPKGFCQARCAAHVKQVNRCMKKRKQIYCDHPEREEAGKYGK